MKSCPQCKRGFPDEAGFCPEDGSPLQTASMVPAATGDDSRLGSLLAGRYEIRRVVADGGMGRVYEGIDKATQSRVAVKVLHADVAQDPVSLERFKREYEISSALPHDHIVKVLDFQRDPIADVWLLVMEFLDGEELRYVLKREKTIPPERVIRLLSQVAIGLDAAHARQIVHRDLKPDNLFLCGTRQGDVVKILDFGSVKDKSKDAKKLTALGTTIGSPYYMAPEQAQGLETLDARADVFALGAITYECLTGSVPFNGNNGPSILLAILTKDPEPASLRSADAKRPIPAAVDDVIESALAKNPNIRTTSVGELALALGKAYGSRVTFAHGHRRRLARLRKPLKPALRAPRRPSPGRLRWPRLPIPSPSRHGYMLAMARALPSRQPQRTPSEGTQPRRAPGLRTVPSRSRLSRYLACGAPERVYGSSRCSSVLSHWLPGPLPWSPS